MIRLLFALAVAATALALPRPAAACGGFACSAAQPVVQDAEQIIFSDNGDGTVTAVIQIQYSGAAESFAWVLPVPGTPEIGVSSNLAFSRLGLQTAPQFQLTRSSEGACDTPPPFLGADAAADSAAADAGSFVDVVDSGTVGPYDYVTISLDPEAENPGDVAVDFLRDGGYDVDETARDLLGPYLASGMNLIAFRLTKNALSGSIRPIVMTYTSARATIPIRPTAMAAADEMGVRVWVLGEHRAIPANYRHVVLNLARYDWLSPAGNYNALVSAAVDEAGGRAFVTELAGARAAIMPSVFNESETLDPTRYDGIDGFELVAELVNRYGLFDGMGDALTAHLSLPEGIPVANFLSCPNCFRGDFAADAFDAFDRAGFLASVEGLVVAPLRATHELLGRRPYMTRLYTRISAEEMTVDPEFDFNPDLSDVSNRHTATQVIHCAPNRYVADAPWTVTLPDGLGTVEGQFGWPYRAAFESPPAALRIEQLGTSGPPEIVEDRTDTVRARLASDASSFRPTPGHTPGSGDPDPMDPSDPRDPDPTMSAGADDFGCGCRVGGGASGSAWVVFLATAWFWRRRRR